eukprot:SAG31_NODE_21535_length_547_cov_0.685268_1_plen_76_part_10
MIIGNEEGATYFQGATNVLGTLTATHIKTNNDILEMGDSIESFTMKRADATVGNAGDFLIRGQNGGASGAGGDISL